MEFLPARKKVAKTVDYLEIKPEKLRAEMMAIKMAPLKEL
jgi:hypothetical protein